MTREEWVGEVTKYRKLMSEMKANMECPVCLILPREGPVPCCPRGHLLCRSCLDKMLPKVDGKKECPTCREPMGEGKSLLAKMLIENMEHECDLDGCKEVLPFNEHEQHKKVCAFRPVICPGNNPPCKAMVPFCEVEKHAEICPEIAHWSPVLGKTHTGLSLPQDRLNDQNVTWNTFQFNIDGEVFFLRSRKEVNNFVFELVMKGDEADCKRFTATIAILDSNWEPSYISISNPRPLGISNDEDSCLSVRMKSLAKVWQLRGDSYRFDVSVVIKSSLRVEGQVRLRTEKKKQDEDILLIE